MSQNPDNRHSLQTAPRSEAEEVFEAALASYFAKRHARVDAFVDRHFSFRGSLALHRHALGWDMLRVPVNLFLTGPTAALKAAAVIVRGMGANTLANWLDTRDLFLKTAVARRIEELIRTELLGMPPDPDGRPSGDDALFRTMLADPRVSHMLREASGPAPAGKMSAVGLSEILATYRGTRTAAGEVSSACVTLGVGAVAFGKVTPGVVSLGPSVAAFIAHQAAVASFPLGATLGGLWYAVFPASVPTGLLVGAIVVLVLISASLAAFAGVIADPIQRRFGLHQRRLHRMLDVLATNLRGPSRESLAVKDHYVARLLDLLDYAAAVSRFVRPG
ncbi:MAG TPA: DUF6635 family protein [Azospirillum sp.]|nr:DUF6635 family protein [Azospirillum sp.]